MAGIKCLVQTLYVCGRLYSHCCHDSHNILRETEFVNGLFPKIFCFYRVYVISHRVYVISLIHCSCLWIAFYPEIILSISAVFRKYITQQQVFLDLGRSGGNFCEISFLRLPTSLRQYPFKGLFSISGRTCRNENCAATISFQGFVLYIGQDVP